MARNNATTGDEKSDEFPPTVTETKEYGDGCIRLVTIDGDPKTDLISFPSDRQMETVGALQ